MKHQLLLYHLLRNVKTLCIPSVCFKSIFYLKLCMIFFSSLQFAAQQVIFLEVPLLPHAWILLWYVLFPSMYQININNLCICLNKSIVLSLAYICLNRIRKIKSEMAVV